MERMNDWTGNSVSIFSCHGASNHSDTEREINDYYATPPMAVGMLMELEDFSNRIWEPACGEGHIAEVLMQYGKEVVASDLIDRRYGTGNIDFLNTKKMVDMDIITNPPYSMAKEFVEHAMNIVTDGHKVAMFLKLTFLEGQGRKELFEKYPPKIIYVSTSRLGCAKNGEFKKDKKGNLKADSAVAYAWFVWEKGSTTEPIVRWFN